MQLSKLPDETSPHNILEVNALNAFHEVEPPRQPKDAKQQFVNDSCV